MKHRVFIAINLPEEIKTALTDCQNKYLELPARWTKPENLHITLEFLGYVNDEDLEGIKQIIIDITTKCKSFSANLTNICYAPPKIMPPRMVWAIGEKSEGFSSLCDNLKRGLSDLLKVSFKPENREIIPHITLARIKEWEWRRIEPDERPEVGENIDFSFEVKSIELMESVLKKPGPEYTVLESFNLNK